MNFVRLLILSAIFTLTSARVQEAADGSVCFNNCNGHGECVDYSCHCFNGYFGDDCSSTFADESNFMQILSTGHFNVTKKNYTEVVSKNKLLLLGFSSYNCHRCIQVEAHYNNVSMKLKELKVPFGRVDADTMKSVALEIGASELPALVLFNNKRPFVYRGVHSSDAVIAFVEKQLAKPLTTLKSVEEVTKFIQSREDPKYSVSTIMVVGFFSEHEDVEEDEYVEYEDVAKELKHNEDIYFGVVTNPKVAEWFKKNKTIDRTPSLLVAGERDERHTINLNELYGDNMGVKEWIQKNAIPLVGKMTPQNFQLYDKLRIPMLLFFLDLTDEHNVRTAAGQSIVGGRSGGIFNEVLIEEFREAAREHVGRIVFVYLDGTLYADQMKSLGLYGGKERLPSLAFNTRDGAQIPFPEELAINRETILQFCADFISGKLRNAADAAEMAKKALQASVPLSGKNKAARKEKKSAPEVVRGVSEQFGDGNVGDTAVMAVNLTTFDEIIMNPDKDVVLLLHSKACESCAHFNMYYKRMAERFKDLALPSLQITQMDVSDQTPPANLNLMVGQLPILVILPAGEKQPPWVFYSGIGKVQAMMKWIQKRVAIPFELPNLPHLTEKDRIAYKTQVREREEALDKKRIEDRRAMEAEEREQVEVVRRRRKEEKKQELLKEGGKDEVDKEETEKASKAAMPAKNEQKSRITMDFDDNDENDHDEF